MKKLYRGLFFIDCILFLLILATIIKTENPSISASVIPKEQYADVKIKKVAITFDDGPHPTYTPKVLDVLREKNVKATFFLIGKEAEKYPEIVKRMAEEGHTIGNHTYSHVNLATLSYEESLEEIRTTNQIIEDITGTGPEFIRPPFGACNDGLEKELSMCTALWNIDTLDWTGKSVEYIYNTTRKKVKDGSIILMHDGYENTVEALELIIDELKGEYEFVTLEELMFD